MSRALSPSISRRYGLARVARVWNVSRAGIYRFRSDTRSDTIARRPGPVGACSDAELAEHIRRQIIDSGFHGEGYRKIWARLRFAVVASRALGACGGLWASTACSRRIAPDGPRPRRMMERSSPTTLMKCGERT